jgi:hypothetical protein
VALDYNEVLQFMKEFKIDFLNRSHELIIDEPTNTYVDINTCETIEDVKTHVVYALCRPIGKGLNDRDASRLLGRLNRYFNKSLTQSDMLRMYVELCYISKLEEFKDFIKRGFPIEELKTEEDYR